MSGDKCTKCMTGVWCGDGACSQWTEYPEPGTDTQDGDTLQPGTRVEIVRWAIGPSGYDDSQNVPVGTQGTVIDREENSAGLLACGAWVAWDNGARLKLLYGKDLWKVIA